MFLHTKKLWKSCQILAYVFIIDSLNASFFFQRFMFVEKIENLPLEKGEVVKHRSQDPGGSAEVKNIGAWSQ